MNKVLPRRTVLKGVGTALALPFLEAMGQRSLQAGDGDKKSSFPKRLVCLYVPAGVCNEAWYPQKVGYGLELSSTLKPLDPIKRQLTVVSGLWHPNGVGHHNCGSSFLNGRNNSKDPGISLDQEVAKTCWRETRFPSLQWGVHGPGQASMSFSEEGVGLPGMVDNDAIFKRLFEPEDPQTRVTARRTQERRSSVLDSVRAEAKMLEGKLGAADRQRLEQYFYAVRDVELLVQQARHFVDSPKPTAERDVLTSDLPGSARDVRIKFGLLYLALVTDSSRVIAWTIDKEGTQATFPNLGFNDSRHGLTHHGGDAKLLEKLARTDHFYVSELARFLMQLQDTKEGDGSLLDRTALLYGTGLNNGAGFANGTGSHLNDKMAMLVAGGRSLGFRGDNHIKVDDGKVPMCNMYLSVLRTFGYEKKTFSDSTGTLQGFYA